MPTYYNKPRNTNLRLTITNAPAWFVSRLTYPWWLDMPDGARCAARRIDVGLVGPWHKFALQLLAGNGGGCSGGGGKKSVQLFGTNNEKIKKTSIVHSGSLQSCNLQFTWWILWICVLFWLCRVALIRIRVWAGRARRTSLRVFVAALAWTAAQQHRCGVWRWIVRWLCRDEHI